MSTDPHNPEGLGGLLRVIGEALDDDDFRARFKKDPKSVLHEQAGLKLDDSVRVHVHENSRTELHIVLPARLEDLDDPGRRLLNMWPV